MMRLFLLGIVLILGLSANAKAQEQPTNSTQATDLFIGSSTTRETLLYRKAADLYIVSVMGERFIDRAYFEIEVTRNGQPVPVDTLITVNVEPSHLTDQILVIDDIVNENGTPRSYRAQYRSDGLFVVNPMTFDSAGGWLVHLSIEGKEGVSSTSFQMRVYPHKPDTPPGFSIINLGAPVLITLALLMFYRWRKIPLIAAR